MHVKVLALALWFTNIRCLLFGAFVSFFLSFAGNKSKTVFSFAHCSTFVMATNHVLGPFIMARVPRSIRKYNICLFFFSLFPTFAFFNLGHFGKCLPSMISDRLMAYLIVYEMHFQIPQNEMIAFKLISANLLDM